MNSSQWSTGGNALESIIDRLGELAEFHRDRNRTLSSMRDDISALGMERLGSLGPWRLDNEPCRGIDYVAIDGAHVTEDDRGSAYSVSAAVALALDGSQRSMNCLAVLPHLASVADVSAGLMFMQEVMLSVEAAEADPARLVLIDGSRVSTVIAIDSFYRVMATERKGLLSSWRSAQGDPGSTIVRFESSNWVRRYLAAPNIVANTKMVSARRLLRAIAPDADSDSHLMMLDDKLAATIILAPDGVVAGGEGVGPFPMDMPKTPFKIKGATEDGEGYVFAEDVDAELRALAEYPPPPDRGEAPECVGDRGKLGLFAFYLNPTAMHGAYCLEVNARFFASPVAARLSEGCEGSSDVRVMRGLAAWARAETASADVQEPYLNHVADRVVKGAVSAAKEVFKSVTAMQGESAEWNLSRPRRT